MKKIKLWKHKKFLNKFGKKQKIINDFRKKRIKKI
jgi:hypothetical protein